MDWTDVKSEQERAVGCEHDNESSGSTKCVEITDVLRNC
jgi:hypothetical protein